MAPPEIWNREEIFHAGFRFPVKYRCRGSALVGSGLELSVSPPHSLSAPQGGLIKARMYPVMVTGLSPPLCRLSPKCFFQVTRELPELGPSDGAFLGFPLCLISFLQFPLLYFQGYALPVALLNFGVTYNLVLFSFLYLPSRS